MAKGEKSRSSNDQRSDAKNSTSQEHKAVQDNRANQMNPNNKTSKRK